MSETPSAEDPRAHTRAVDVALAASTLAASTVAEAARRASDVLRPAVGLALRPPLVPESLHPQTWLDSLGRAGADQREEIRQRMNDLLDLVVPLVVAEVVRRIDLTSLVIDHVDLEQVVAQVDPNHVAARVDVDSVSERVDLDAIVERLDLTAIVLEQVDLEAVIAAALEQIDMVSLAGDVIEGVDLPSIIRDSSGAMASDAVREVRMHGIAADQAIGRAMDRLLLRRGNRSTPSSDQTSAPASGPNAAEESES